MSFHLEDHRRKWSREEYEKAAYERIRREIVEDELGLLKKPRSSTKKELLKHRDYKIDLDSKIGRSQVIKKSGTLADSGGYYCNVCDCVVKDSINFLDHVNGTKHQKIMGMSMKIERSSLDQVRARFALNKKKREEKKKDYDLEARVRELEEEERRVKENIRERRKCKRKLEKDDDDLEDEVTGPADLMTAVMGFSNFGSTKK